jgi:hypothetical protein
MRLKSPLSLLLLVFSVTLCKAEKRIALVVGNSSYQSVAPLNNPKNDAALIADTLRQSGLRLKLGGKERVAFDPSGH